MGNADHPRRRPTPDDEPSSVGPGSPGFSLTDYVERQFALMRDSGMPTMAEWLADVEKQKANHPPAPTLTAKDIVEAIHESRAEQERRMDGWLGLD